MIWNFRHSIFLYLLLLLLSFTNEVNAQGKHLQFDQLTVNDGLPQNSVYSIAQDKYGFMWFGTWGGAVRYDGYKMKVFRAHGNDTTSFSDNRISAIFSDSLQNIWIEVEPREFLFKYNYETETFSRFPKDQVPYDVSKKLKERYGSNEKQEENQTYRWITSPNGLVQINRKTGDTTIYRADSNDPLSISGNWVKYIYLDDSEHLWVGTQSVGVNYADLYTKPFVNYYKGQNGDRLIDNAVRAVCKDHQGRIWVGSENQGITIIAPSQDGPEYFYIGEEKIQNLQIRALYCDSQGIVWIGTKRGLYYYDPEEDSFTQCSKATCNLGIFSITEDQNGNLWVGTFYALALYDKQNDRFRCYDNNLGLAGSQIMDLMVDHANNLWIATEDGGLSRLKPDEGSIESGVFDITNYTYTTGTEKGLLSNRTYSLAEDQEGQIWIATTEGLSRLNPKTNTFQHFTEQNGLTDELTMAVAFDGKESVWVSHTKGLSRVNTLTGELQNFNMKDGLQGNEFKQNATYHHTESGRLFFGGSNGLTSFDPDQINTNPYPPQMVLTKLNIMHQDVQRGTMVNDRKILENSLLTTDKITLTW